MAAKDVLSKCIKLSNGVEMPQFGLGTFLMNNEKECYDAVITALNAGYRHIDTAEYYKNEPAIGRAIQDFLSQNPEVKRSDLFIVSKIWNENNRYEFAKASFNNMLKQLQLDYLDLCLIHWPTEYSPECWKLLQEMYDLKKVRAIGVSNFTIKHLEPFLKNAKYKPMVNQIESHPGFNQSELVDFCHNNNIAITSWRTMLGGKGDGIPLLVELAEKYQTSPSHIALRWAWQLNQIVIPKSVHQERIINNVKIDHFNLTTDEMQAINNLPQQNGMWSVLNKTIFNWKW